MNFNNQVILFAISVIIIIAINFLFRLESVPQTLNQPTAIVEDSVQFLPFRTDSLRNLMNRYIHSISLSPDKMVYDTTKNTSLFIEINYITSNQKLDLFSNKLNKKYADTTNSPFYIWQGPTNFKAAFEFYDNDKSYVRVPADFIFNLLPKI